MIANLTVGFIHGERIISPLAEFDEVKAKTAQVGVLSPLADDEELVIASKKGLKFTDTKGNTLIDFDGLGNARFTGTVTANKIKANEIEGLSLITGRIESITGTFKELNNASQQQIDSLSSRLGQLESDLRVPGVDKQKTASSEAVLSDSGLAGKMNPSSISTIASDSAVVKGSGPEGDRAPGIELEGFIPNQSGPTPKFSITDASVSAQLASASATLTSTSLSISTASGSAERSASSSASLTNAVVSEDLTVAGNAKVNRLNATGQISSGLLVIDGIETDGDGLIGASISTLSGPLRLQSLALGGVELVGGKVTIDKNGNVRVRGNLTTDTLSINEDKPEVASVGKASIPAGQTAVTVNTTRMTERSHVFTSLRTKSGGKPLVVTNRVAGTSFTVEIEAAYTEDIEFDWWVVN